MKKFLLGVLFTLVVGGLSNYLVFGPERQEDTKLYKVADFIMWKVVLAGYVLDPIEGNCKDEQGENGFGWKFNVADYYKCDRLQRALNGNFKAPNSKSPTF